MLVRTGFLAAACLGLGALLVAAPAPQALPVLDLEFHKGVPPSELKVAVTPTGNAAREGNIVVLPVKVKNESQFDLKAALAHEWHGGEWPSTNLFASVTPAGNKKPRDLVPVYLAGEDPRDSTPTVIKPGGALDLKVRADWPGTGSVKTSPLIEKAGEYRVEVVLVFEAEGKKQYVRGPATTVHLLEKK